MKRLVAIALSTIALTGALSAQRGTPAKPLEIYVVDTEGGKAALWVSPTGQSLVDDRISVVLNTQGSATVQKLIGEAQTASAGAVSAYKGIVKLTPNDPNIQLELAQAAQQAGDAASAIAAYTAFLKLAPDDPNAPIVKQQLKQLRQTSTSSG